MINKAKAKIQSSKVAILGLTLLKHPLFSGSALMIVGSNFANFFAYVYHLLYGRILGPSNYSELATIISLVGLLGVISGSFNLVIVKFVSSAEKNQEEELYSWLTKMGLLLGVIIAILFSILSPILSNFLHIKLSTLFLVGPIFLFSTLSFINKSFLQGLLKFKEFVVMINAESFLRLVLGLLFVYLGFSVFGATFGFLCAYILGWLLSLRFLSGYKVKKTKKFERQGELIKYAIPIFLQTIAITSLLSTDVVLVKHFLDSHQAGIYASLSTLGRIIFFGAAPVSSVMFPMVSKRHAKGHGYKRIFIYSLLLTLLIASGVLFFYLLFPEFAIRLLFGSAYIEGAPLLFWFGVFMTLFTLASLFVSFFLSIGKTKIVILPIIAALSQALGIWFWHTTVLAVIKVSIFSVSFLIISLLIYFGHESIKAKEKS